MFAQAILIFLLLLGFIFLNWKLWIKAIVYKYFDFQDDTAAEIELDREIEELKLKRNTVAAMKETVSTEKELAKLNKQIEKLQEMRDAIDL